VVVVVQSGRFECLRLPGFEHAQRHAGLQAQGPDLAHHLGHFLHVALLRAAPGRAHAEAGRALGPGGLRSLHDLGQRHQLAGLDAGFEMGRLRAVAAILAAAAGLDRQQGGQLHFVRVEVLAVHLLGLVQQVHERQREQRLDVGDAPAHRGARAVGRGAARAQARNVDGG
jgi:hypothetical protein